MKARLTSLVIFAIHPRPRRPSTLGGMRPTPQLCHPGLAYVAPGPIVARRVENRPAYVTVPALPPPAPYHVEEVRYGIPIWKTAWQRIPRWPLSRRLSRHPTARLRRVYRLACAEGHDQGG
jgi:hypothetical protein